ncbi:ubiquitin carboxyl-terminal hydrolase 47-like isoform X2 [Salarias fasciatus]|uniref:ubiquitin carboxyl-terminal hydrolase 47-like isoform X2 n=1 Tax=Salarias fasciatus TaxID=181472 RepID=UPI0011765A78|nr:ubiquitin carboxyl-terminal hydrolase 47-like isoform X2 [Salarias fasciatus]
MEVSMNTRLVKKFANELDNLCISDYNGLNSPGLTCYLNSVLQVLFMTQGFRYEVKSCSKDIKETIDSHLAELFSALEKEVTKTRAVVKMLGITDVYEQRDAAEYFEKILSQASPQASQIFQGELKHNIRCLACDKESSSDSFFWILPISMVDSKHKTYSVEEGLNAFFKAQTFSSDNQLYCSGCQKKQDANITCEVAKAPGVFTLLLKRFSFDDKQRRYTKLLCTAVVPKTLSVKECTYDLYAVVNHHGSLTGGHYTADIRSFETGQWYCFNDDIVSSLKSQPFGGEDSLSVNTASFPHRSATAYLLVYRQVNKQPEETGGTHLEARRTQSDGKRPNGTKRSESPKPFNGGISCDSPVNHEPVDMFDQSLPVLREVPNGKCFKSNTMKKEVRSCTWEETLSQSMKTNFPTGTNKLNLNSESEHRLGRKDTRVLGGETAKRVKAGVKKTFR